MSIAESYNNCSSQYDSNKNCTRDLDQKLTIASLRSYDFDAVLELGCGTVKNTVWLVENAKKLIGLDFSEEMLNIAREIITDPKVNFEKADLTKDWKVDNDFADLITVNLVLEHIEDLKHIFDQARLKLKKDGLFFICELHPFKQYAVSKARFDTADARQELEVYIHDISEYLNQAKTSGFELIEMKEWRDDVSKNELPRLVSFLFKG
jgi:ubiquinone/menaquinone biosynthesis C-methylase UbiE